MATRTALQLGAGALVMLGAMDLAVVNLWLVPRAWPHWFEQARLRSPPSEPAVAAASADTTPDPEPDLAPDPAADPAADPAPDPAPDPAADPAPDPEPDPEPDPAPDPEPDPEPDPAPDPAPPPAQVEVPRRDALAAARAPTDDRESIGQSVPASPDTPPPPEQLQPAARGGGLLLQEIVVSYPINRARSPTTPWAALDQMVERLESDPKTYVVIEGHTDELGEQGVNEELSRLRAQVLASYFETHGVSEERIVVRSHAAAQPLDGRHTRAAWSKNRRAHVKLERSQR